MRSIAGQTTRSFSGTKPDSQQPETRALSRNSAAERFAETAARVGFVCSMLFFAAAALYGFSLSGLPSVYFTSAIAFADRNAADLGYRIETLDLTGVRQTPKELISAALRLPHTGSIFSFDTAAARDRLLQIGWIETAEVRRNLPSKLEVTITERTPFARFFNGGKVYVIDREGKTLGEDIDNTFSHLFLVKGEGAGAAASLLIDSLVLARNVGAKVESSELVADRFWIVKLVSGFQAKLPRKVTTLSLSRLETLLANEKVAEMPIETIDLRLPHRTILQLKNATAELRDKAVAGLTAVADPTSIETTLGKSHPL